MFDRPEETAAIPRPRYRLAIALAGAVVTLYCFADQPIWANLSMCGIAEREALTEAFPSHPERLANLGSLLVSGEFEIFAMRARAYSRTLMPNGIIVLATAAFWWAGAHAVTVGLRRFASRSG